jgi:hypothetical protein
MAVEQILQGKRFQQKKANKKSEARKEKEV